MALGFLRNNLFICKKIDEYESEQANHVRINQTKCA